MADISQYLQAIMSAVYGEDVRGSIHDAIAIINDVSEKSLDVGTAVTSPSSSSTGYFVDSLYLNSDTDDLWKCIGTNSWSKVGNVKGSDGEQGADGDDGVGIVGITKTDTQGLIDTYTITYTDGSSSTFTVTNGTRGADGSTPNITMSATADNTSSANPSVLVTKTGTPDNPNFALAFSGLKGQQGVQGEQGQTGAAGNGIVSITKTGTSGLVDTYTILYTNGTSSTFTVTNGQDGQGSGDMTKLVYDSTNAVADAGGIPAYVAANAAIYTAGANIQISNQNVISATDTRYEPATPNASGLMSASDKSKLDGIQSGAEENVQADWNQSDTSKDDYIKNKPTIPAAQVNADWNASSGVAQILNKPTIPAAQIQSDWNQTTTTAKDYIKNKPTIPTVNNGTLTIQKNGTNVQTFTANQSSNVTANIVTDDWTATATVSSSGTVTFTGLNDSYGYDLYCQNKLLGISAISKTGSGTSVSITYTVTGSSSGDVCKLRILK